MLAVCLQMLSPGDFVFKQDDVCRCLYIVNSGTVEVVAWDSNTNDYTVRSIKTPFAEKSSPKIGMSHYYVVEIRDSIVSC